MKIQIQGMHSQLLSLIRLFVTLWTVALPTLTPQAPLFIGFPARILEWVAISYSEGSFQPRDRTCVSCLSRRILYYYWVTWESLGSKEASVTG